MGDIMHTECSIINKRNSSKRNSSKGFAVNMNKKFSDMSIDSNISSFMIHLKKTSILENNNNTDNMNKNST